MCVLRGVEKMDKTVVILLVSLQMTRFGGKRENTSEGNKMRAH